MAVTVLACGTWVTLAAALGPLASPLPQALGIGAAGAVGPVVGEPPAPREGPRGARPSRPGRTSPGTVGLDRLADHVRHGGPVGVARPAPPGPWPDHHRRDGEDTRASNRGSAPTATRSASTRPPMTWPTAVSCASWTATRTPTRSRGHGPSVTSITAADRPGAVRGRRTVPRAVPAPARHRRRRDRLRQERRTQRTASPTSPPAATWSSGPSTSNAAWNCGPGPRASTGSRPRRPKPPRCWPTRSPSCTPALSTSRTTAGASGNHRERMPALVIIIDEYAELAEQAPGAMKDTDTIARLGRAPAVTLVAATQRPTQKVMGQGAVRSQMNIRIAFRVQEQRDVDLILGQGMLKAGWHAHKLNAPGKFLVSVTRARHPPPRPRLPRHRRRRDRRGRTLRTRPPAARRHLTPCPGRRPLPPAPQPPDEPSPDHRAAAPDDAEPARSTRRRSNRTRTRSCDARCPPRQPKAFPSATSSRSPA